MATVPLTLVVGLSMHLFAAALFAVAVIHKLRDYRGFMAVLAAYRLAPAAWVRMLAGLVIAAELLALLGLLLPTLYLQYLAAALLAAYAVAMQINVTRGRTEISCGCGGPALPISRALVWRNFALAGLLAWSVGSAGMAHLYRLDAAYLALVAGTVACLGCLYQAFNQICANAGLQAKLLGSSRL